VEQTGTSRPQFRIEIQLGVLLTHQKRRFGTYPAQRKVGDVGVRGPLRPMLSSYRANILRRWSPKSSKEEQASGRSQWVYECIMVLYRLSLSRPPASSQRWMSMIWYITIECTVTWIIVLVSHAGLGSDVCLETWNIVRWPQIGATRTRILSNT
jgi:hypothetical protein